MVVDKPQAREVRQTQYVDAEEEVANGLIGYFDKCLLALLLYRNERGQAAQVGPPRPCHPSHASSQKGP